MNSDPRGAVALDLLAKTGIWRSSYEPPLVRALWKLGFNIPPPHFVSFWKVALSSGLFFGLLWGFLMWLSVWFRSNMPSGPMFAVFASVFFGLWMESFYANGRRKYKLPPWSSLNASSPDA